MSNRALNVDFNIDNFVLGLENNPNLSWPEIERAILYYARLGDAFYSKAGQPR